MNLLVHARHGGQDRRAHLGKRLGDARDVGDQRDRRAAERSGLMGKPGVTVRHREEQEHDVARVLQSFDHAGRGGDEVAVREHAALRGPRGSGRVDQRREVVLLDRLGLQVPGQAAVGLELVEPVEGDDLPQRRQRAADGDEFPRLLLVLGKGEHRLGVGQHVLALLRRARRVEADDDGADRHHRPVEQDPLEPRARQHRHAIALANAARQQPMRERVDPFGRLVPRHRPPAVVLLLEICGPVGRAADDVAPELRRCAHVRIVELALRAKSCALRPGRERNSANGRARSPVGSVLRAHGAERVRTLVPSRARRPCGVHARYSATA